MATNEKLDDEKLDKLYKKIAIVQYNSETKLNAFKLDYLDWIYAFPDKKQYADLRDHLNAIRSRCKKLTPKKSKQEAVGEEK